MITLEENLLNQKPQIWNTIPLWEICGARVRETPVSCHILLLTLLVFLKSKTM